MAGAGQAWRPHSQVPVRVFVAPLMQQADLAQHGARADILVGIGAAPMRKAEHLGALEPATCRIVGRNPIVLAVHGPERRPIALGWGSSINRLLGSGRFGLVDLAIGDTGAETREALARVGLWPALEPRSLGAENTTALAALLTEGAVRVAALYQSDVVSHPDLAVAATFSSNVPIVLAAVTANARSPNAKAFLSFLLGGGLEALKRAGLQAP